MTRSWLAAIAICVAAAALEGVMAGRGVRSRLDRLRQPRHSPPFAVWVGIGIFYYLTCCAILVRLLDASPSRLRSAALALVAVVLILNAIWNLAFFRFESIDSSIIVLMAYVVVSLVLALVLARLDPVSGRVFLPYLIYLSYATWWSLALRRLNRAA